jgi:N-acetylglutamate synthase-like GNAT family acetyltransferase
MKLIRLFCNIILRVFNYLFALNFKVQSAHKAINISGQKRNGIQINTFFLRKKVGWVYLTGGRYYSPENSPYGILYSLVVAVVFRRLGIGKLLIEQCVKQSKEKGLKELIVLVNKSNKGAIKFYKEIGFVDAEKGLYFDKYKLELSDFHAVTRFPIGSFIVMVIPT